MADREEYLSQLIDEPLLKSFLEEEFGDVDKFEFERHEGGHSNETLFITWGSHDLVVRRPPPGKTAQAAHDVLREHRVLSSMQNTPVPTPDVFIASEDDSILGSEFYIMERVKGRVLRSDEPDYISKPNHRRRIGEELIDTLAEIHNIDYEATGLGGLGYPEEYLERQIDRWSKQYDWARERTGEVRRLPEVEDVRNWLTSNIPESPKQRLVHGDYKLDNVMLSFDLPPKIVSVFDWEMATLGDPLTDIGWLLHYWKDVGDKASRTGEFVPEFTARDGYPKRKSLVERYERKTGIKFENPRFYRTLTAFKLGAIGEMFFRRHLEGNSEDGKYPKMKHQVPLLIEEANEFIEANHNSLL